jgi:hypothetical protein
VTAPFSVPDYMTRATVPELEAWSGEAKRLAGVLRGMPVNPERTVLIAETEEFARQCDLAMAERRLHGLEARR